MGYQTATIAQARTSAADTVPMVDTAEPGNGEVSTGVAQTWRDTAEPILSYTIRGQFTGGWWPYS